MSTVNEIRFICQLEKKSSTIILSVGIKYSVRGLLCDVDNYAGSAN